MSPEIDIAPMRDADADALSDQLSFDVGEWSEFHATYGFYIEGVGKRTAILPPDWEYRLVGVRSEASNGTPLPGQPPWRAENRGISDASSGASRKNNVQNRFTDMCWGSS